MTSRQIFESVLIELSKIQAPALKLYEFNYLFNKAINQYINKTYNVYDINQQTTDDLRVLKATAYLIPIKSNSSNTAITNGSVNASSYLSQIHNSLQTLSGATYEAQLPSDYLHLLNCICVYYVAKQKDCWDAGSYIQIPATRLTADSWAQAINDIYNRPTPMRPYYYLHNVNTSNVEPTNPYKEEIVGSTDQTAPVYIPLLKEYWESRVKSSEEASTDPAIQIPSDSQLINHEYNAPNDTITNTAWFYYDVKPESGTGIPSYHLYFTDSQGQKCYVYEKDSNISIIKDGENNGGYVKVTVNPSFSAVDGRKGTFKRTFTFGNREASTIEKPAMSRHANASSVRLEIRYGKDDTLFQLKEVQVDYLKAPQFIRLTQEQIDLTEDTSQIMEYPDYVCQEIINELVHLVMEHNNDPRLGNNLQITQTVARPTQQQTQTAQA